MDKRYSLSFAAFNKLNLIAAKKLALEMERDMLDGKFDQSLVKYSPRKAKRTEPSKKIELSFSASFEHWAKNYMQIDCNVNMHYYGVRNMLRRWGNVEASDVLFHLNTEEIGHQTYNERLSILREYADFFVRQGVWKSNPLEDVCSKKLKHTEHTDRKPFTPDEIFKILQVFRENQKQLINTRVDLSIYYPFLYFIFKTGVRNAEGVGLRAGHIDIKNRLVHIRESLSRTYKGTNSSARVRKETKNGKVRSLPLTDDLLEVLLPSLKGREFDDLVFTTVKGLPIDDKMFQRMYFKPVLKALGIPPRVLYACRHTFGSRCIDAGITPVMTAFLMGNNPETALRNYTHQIGLPKDLPSI